MLGIIASQNYPRITNSYESIQTVTVGAGGQASISFTSIPSTFKHLQIRGIARQAGGGDTQNYMRFNGDTATNYSTHAVFGYGSGTGVLGNDNVNYMSVAAATSLATNVFVGVVVDILEYSNANTYKTMRAISGDDQNGGGYVWFSSGNWRNTSAINSITIYNNSSQNFVQYSSFALYGIKG